MLADAVKKSFNSVAKMFLEVFLGYFFGIFGVLYYLGVGLLKVLQKNYHTAIYPMPLFHVFLPWNKYYYM